MLNYVGQNITRLMPVAAESLRWSLNLLSSSHGAYAQKLSSQRSSRVYIDSMSNVTPNRALALAPADVPRQMDLICSEMRNVQMTPVYSNPCIRDLHQDRRQRA